MGSTSNNNNCQSPTRYNRAAACGLYNKEVRSTDEYPRQQRAEV